MHKSLFDLSMEKTCAAEMPHTVKFSNETGTGSMTICPLFHGAELYYNDMHLAFFEEAPAPTRNVIEINHCRVGRYECSFGENSCCYLAAGDFAVCTAARKKSSSCFPLRHYHGITILLDLDAIPPEMRRQMEWYGVDLDVIRRYICTENRCCILRSAPTIAHVFSELYTAHSVPDTGYLRLKVLELLHILTRLKSREDVQQTEYFNQHQVECVKQAAALLTRELTVHRTIEQLAQEVGLSPTALKSCFKGVYGSSVYLSGLSQKIRAVEKQSVAAELETALFVSSASMVLKLGIASVALTGSVLLVNGSIDVLTLFLFLMAASRMYDPMQGALQNLAAVIAMRTNVGRMNEILEYPVQTGSETMTNQGCDIVFDHVGFAYNSGETVLKDVSFTAKQGEVTALVGPSGGGKTTVSRLAARFWDNQKGRITVGGMDISQIDPEKLMSLYSIVFQDVTLFDNTILENIRLGRKDATDEEVLAAAKLANCDEFVEKLPDKWNTNIGENGCALSGGERQRVSIARAFLKDAPIILLDEATASLDVENETAIQEALSRLIKNKTVLIIAHRMRTVAGADKVVVLKDGIVAEQGRPDELYARNGLYAHMVDLQSASQNWTI